MNDDLVIQEITVSRYITADGGKGFSVAMNEDTSFIEALGMLDAARWELFTQMSERFPR